MTRRRAVVPLGEEPPVAEQTVAITAGSTRSTRFNAKTSLIGAHTSASCRIAIGTDPTAAATSRRMAASTTERVDVIAGSKLAVIAGT